MESQKSTFKPFAIFGGIVVVIAGIIGYISIGNKANTTSVDTTTTATKPTASGTNTQVNTNESATLTTSSASTAQNAKYKDGTYSAEGSYFSPTGGEKVGVELTTKGDIVTDVVFIPEATHPTSVNFQNKFAAGYKQYVVGKSLDQINVGKVSGSSLTPNGFNDAVAKIKVEAKA